MHLPRASRSVALLATVATLLSAVAGLLLVATTTVATLLLLVVATCYCPSSAMLFS
jgi:hypothetical protein